MGVRPPLPAPYLNLRKISDLQNGLNQCAQKCAHSVPNFPSPASPISKQRCQSLLSCKHRLQTRDPSRVDSNAGSRGQRNEMHSRYAPPQSPALCRKRKAGSRGVQGRSERYGDYARCVSIRNRMRRSFSISSDLAEEEISRDQRGASLIRHQTRACILAEQLARADVAPAKRGASGAAWSLRWLVRTIRSIRPGLPSRRERYAPRCWLRSCRPSSLRFEYRRDRVAMQSTVATLPRRSTPRNTAPSVTLAFANHLRKALIGQVSLCSPKTIATFRRRAPDRLSSVAR
jgi:hypothetical protein